MASQLLFVMPYLELGFNYLDFMNGVMEFFKEQICFKQSRIHSPKEEPFNMIAFGWFFWFLMNENQSGIEFSMECLITNWHCLYPEGSSLLLKALLDIVGRVA